MDDLQKKRKQKLVKYLANAESKPLAVQNTLDILEMDDDIEEIQNSIQDLEETSIRINSEVAILRDILEPFAEAKKGDPGEKGDPGDDGESYTLTEQDKQEIAKLITVPVVEKVVDKVIERVEVIKEVPIVTKEIVQVQSIDEELLPQYGTKFRDGLELIQEESDKLRIEAIGFLKERLDRLEKASRGSSIGWGAHPLTITDGSVVIDKNARRINFGANLSVSRANDGTITVTGSAGGGGSTVETPTGTVNGTNTSFTVSAEPSQVVSDGITYFAGVGYTYGALTITMDVAPSQYIRAII